MNVKIRFRKFSRGLNYAFFYFDKILKENYGGVN